MSRRYIRLYHYDQRGLVLSTGKVSSALLPGRTVPGTRLYARDLVGLGHARRQAAAHAALLTVLRKNHVRPAFRAVALIACPSRDAAAFLTPRSRAGIAVTLTPSTAYLGSFAVQVPGPPWNELVVSNVMGLTLAATEALLAERISDVLRRRVVPIRRSGARQAT